MMKNDGRTRINIPPYEEHATVVRVIDGDTIVVSPDRLDGIQVIVRYLCIDAPDRGEPGYEEAKRANQDLVAGKRVKLVMDTTHLDRYKRYLRYVFVDNVFVNRELVNQGFAKAISFPPDDRFFSEFLALQSDAARRGLGAHPTGVFANEEQYVRQQSYASESGANEARTKGNRSNLIAGVVIAALFAVGIVATLSLVLSFIKGREIGMDSSIRDVGDEPSGDFAQVTRVIDGDTIEVLLNGEKLRVRYVGVSTPKRGKACFDDASDANSKLVDGKIVKLVRDTTDKDRYDRLLRYVYVGEAFVNWELVKDGFAEASLYQPDDMFFAEFSNLEKEAAAAGRGCHPTGVFNDGSFTR